MKLILNEREHINKALNDGYIDSKPTITLRLLAKHYFDIKMDKVQVYDALVSFMGNNYPDFNELKWSDIIKRLIRNVSKSEIVILDVQKVCITSSELESIESINNDKMQRLAFVLLVYAKIFNQMNSTDGNWVNGETKTFFSDCKLCIGREDQELMINKLFEMGLIKLAHKVDSNGLKVLYASEDSDIVIEITDFKDFIYYWLVYKDEGYRKCEGENCGAVFKAKSNNHKMCKVCWKKSEIKNHRERNKKWYRNKNSDGLEKLQNH